MKKSYFIIFILLFTNTHAQQLSQNDSVYVKKLKAELITQSDQKKVTTYLKLSQLLASDSIEFAKEYLYLARLLANEKLIPEVNLELSEIYLKQQNLDSVLFLLNEAIQISEKTLDSVRIQKKLYSKYADALYYKSNYKLSNLYYKKAGQICLRQNDSTAYVDVLIERSYIYESWGQRDSSLLLLEEAINISIIIQYIKGTARASLVLGNLYHGLNNNLKALDYYQKALVAAQQIENKKGIAIIQSNIGMIYLELGNNELAIDYLEQSIEMLIQTKSYIQVANTYDDLAIIYSKKGTKDIVFDYLKQALHLQKKYADKQEIAIGYNVYAECLYRLGENEESNSYLDSCIVIAKETGFMLMLQKSYKLYAENLRILKEYNLAYSYLEMMNQVKDSIMSENFQQQLAEFSIKYNTLEKQREIEQLQHREKLQKANFRTLLISSSSLIFFLLIGTYFISQKRKKLKEIAELKLQKSLIEAKQLADLLELKNKQLTSHALNMLQKNKLLNSFSNSIVKFMENTDMATKNNLKLLKREIDYSIHSEKDWTIFKAYFEQINEGFIQHLKQINPNLTTTEIRLATLLKLNMTNKEMASIFSITHQSIKNARYRLKNKLELHNDIDLNSFISEI